MQCGIVGVKRKDASMYTQVELEKLKDVIDNEADIPRHLEHDVEKMVEFATEKYSSDKVIDFYVTEDHISFAFSSDAEVFIKKSGQRYFAHVSDDSGANSFKIDIDDPNVTVEDFLSRVDRAIDIVVAS